MSRNDPACVFDIELAFDRGLQKITCLRHNRKNRSYRASRYDVVNTGISRNNDCTAYPTDQSTESTGPGLVWAHARHQLRPAPRSPNDVRADVSQPYNRKNKK